MGNKEFRRGLMHLINLEGVDAWLEVPDYIIAEHICSYLELIKETNDRCAEHEENLQEI